MFDRVYGKKGMTGYSGIATEPLWKYLIKLLGAFKETVVTCYTLNPTKDLDIKYIILKLSLETLLDVPIGGVGGPHDSTSHNRYQKGMGWHEVY